MGIPIVIALGCNLGERRATLERACALLERSGVRVVARSRLYWTRPWGVVDQPGFLNAAVRVATGLRPLELLWRCKGIERELGRRREKHWGPRRIDLDLVLYGNIVTRLCGGELVLPHPMIAQRDFVLAPLLDLGVPAPRAVDPRGWQQLLSELPPETRTLVKWETWI